MSRRLMLRNESGSTPILPPEYQQVQYIIFGKGSYLSLGVKDWSQPGFELDFLMPTVRPNQYGPFVISSDATNYLAFCPARDQTSFRLKGTNTDANSILQLNTRYVASLKNKIASVDSFSQEITEGNVVSGSVFVGVYGGNTIDGRYQFTGSIFSLIFFNGNSVTMNLVPCYLKSSGTIGMFDTVSQTFFTNSGASSFTKGADVN